MGSCFPCDRNPPSAVLQSSAPSSPLVESAEPDRHNKLAALNIHLLLTTRNLKAIFTQLDRNESGKIAFDGFKEKLRKQLGGGGNVDELKDGSGFGPVHRADLSRLCEIDAGRGGYEGENR